MPQATLTGIPLRDPVAKCLFEWGLCRPRLHATGKKGAGHLCCGALDHFPAVPHLCRYCEAVYGTWGHAYREDLDP